VKIREAILIGFFLLGAFLRAAPLSSEEAAAVRKHFQETQQATRTLRAEFTSDLKLERLSQSVSSKGVLYYQAPDKVRMEYDEPAGEWVVLSGRKLALKKTNRGIQSFDLDGRPRAQEGLQSLLALVGQGTESWDRTHEVSMFREKNGTRVVLVPKTREDPRQPERIEVLLRDDASLEEIRIRFPGGNGLTYRLERPQRNHPLEAALFEIPEEKETPLDKLKRK
jgi:outer membrane lipoprotein carrier protein